MRLVAVLNSRETTPNYIIQDEKTQKHNLNSSTHAHNTVRIISETAETKVYRFH